MDTKVAAFRPLFLLLALSLLLLFPPFLPFAVAPTLPAGIVHAIRPLCFAQCKSIGLGHAMRRIECQVFGFPAIQAPIFTFPPHFYLLKRVFSACLNDFPIALPNHIWLRNARSGAFQEDLFVNDGQWVVDQIGLVNAWGYHHPHV